MVPSIWAPLCGLSVQESSWPRARLASLLTPTPTLHFQMALWPGAETEAQSSPSLLAAEGTAPGVRQVWVPARHPVCSPGKWGCGGPEWGPGARVLDELEKCPHKTRAFGSPPCGPSGWHSRCPLPKVCGMTRLVYFVHGLQIKCSLSPTGRGWGAGLILHYSLLRECPYGGRWWGTASLR